ncbi:MAG: SPOR domain-containing protein [Burkholderiales bacterium]|nr:SPOR domain-containing protein [Burkholderiales bacterium]
MVIGVLIGLAIALAVALYINSAPSPFKQVQPTATTAPQPASKPADKNRDAPGQTDKSDAKKNRFTYYDILPGTEQPVTEQEIKQAPQGGKDQYFLQAGSFQNESDANNLKAKLALMGVEATIQSANLPDKGVWHRVRIGPFSDIEDMNKSRTTLTQSGIQPSLIKVQEAGAPAKH